MDKRTEIFVVGLLVGGLAVATVPDIPTSIDYMRNREDLRVPTVVCWCAVLALIALVGYEFR